MKNEKEFGSRGITLIALVITIIVLLILAAISIATLTGDNGILTKANNAKNTTVVGEEKEEIKLAYNAVLTEKLGNGDTSKVLASELQGELDNLNAGATADGDNPIKVTFDKTGNKYTVDNSGNISESKKYAFTINGIICYFDESDEGFRLKDDGLAECYILPWIDGHVEESYCCPEGGSEYSLEIGNQNVLIDGDYFGLYLYGKIVEGDSMVWTWYGSEELVNIEQRIKYD